MLVVADEINNTTSHYVLPWLFIVIRRQLSYVVVGQMEKGGREEVGLVTGV